MSIFYNMTILMIKLSNLIILVFKMIQIYAIYLIFYSIRF